jgi:hypothetical protein
MFHIVNSFALISNGSYLSYSNDSENKSQWKQKRIKEQVLCDPDLQLLQKYYKIDIKIQRVSCTLEKNLIEWIWVRGRVVNN